LLAHPLTRSSRDGSPPPGDVIRAAVEHGCLPEDWKATLIADGVLDSYTAVDESVGRSKLFKELTEEEKDMVDIF
jgi:hypothetical protein